MYLKSRFLLAGVMSKTRLFYYLAICLNTSLFFPGYLSKTCPLYYLAKSILLPSNMSTNKPSLLPGDMSKAGPILLPGDMSETILFTYIVIYLNKTSPF